MTGISVRTVFPNLTCFSVYGITRDSSVSANERLSSLFTSEERTPLMLGQGVPLRHPHPEEGLQGGRAPHSLPHHWPGLPGAIGGFSWTSWRGVCSGWCMGWDGSQGRRNAGTSQPPTSPSSPHVEQGAGTGSCRRCLPT